MEPLKVSALFASSACLAIVGCALQRVMLRGTKRIWPLPPAAMSPGAAALRRGRDADMLGPGRHQSAPCAASTRL